MIRKIAWLLVVALVPLTGAGQAGAQSIAGQPYIHGVPARVAVGTAITGTVDVSDGNGGTEAGADIRVSVTGATCNGIPATGTGLVTLNFMTASNQWSGTLTITATNTDTAQTSAPVSVDVVKVNKVQYYDSASKSYVDVAGTLSAPLGGTLKFKAVPDPGTAFPSGQPAWTGAATGTGAQPTFTFSTQSTTAGDKVVDVACGAQTPIPVDVTVYSVTIGVRRQGSGAAFGPAALVAAGGLSPAEHHADVQAQLSPAVSGISLGPPAITLGAGVAQNASLSPTGAVTTDSNGHAAWNFASSDMVRTVTLTLAGQSASIAQGWDDVGEGSDWDYQPYFDYDSAADVTFKPAFVDGTPKAITSHTIDFLVSGLDVWVWNSTSLLYDFHPKAAPNSALAWFSSSPANNPGAGDYTQSLTVHYDPFNIVDAAYFAIEDDNAWKP